MVKITVDPAVLDRLIDRWDNSWHSKSQSFGDWLYTEYDIEQVFSAGQNGFVLWFKDEATAIMFRLKHA